MRIHILGLPHTVSSKEYVACAYTQKVVKFGKMMTERGHEIIHYGHEDSNLICSEHVPVISNKDLEIAYGNYDWRKNFFTFNTGDHAYQTFYKNAIVEVGKRKKPLDFILPFWGSGVKPICDAHQDIICIEPGIGYAGGHWAKYKIFESYAIYHAYYGLNAVGSCRQSWYDTVIPNYFDPDDFEYAPEKKEDYFLFLGRVYDGKGIHIAIQTTKEIGAKLVIAGQNNLQACGYDKTPDHVEFVGYADVEKRKLLMSRAKAAFVPSYYVEPFGGVQIECLMSGTPTITTDWGSFTENNIHGVTGYRCRTFDQFVWAAKNIDKINPKDCRDWALNNFSLERVAPLYEEFFESVLDVHTNKGWYEVHPERAESTFNAKYYPTVTRKKKRVVFYFEPEWAFGRIHYEIFKYLWSEGYDCDLLSWIKIYTPEELRELNYTTDLFVSTPTAWVKAMVGFGIPPEKCIMMLHGRADIPEQLGTFGRDLNRFYKYACVSDWLVGVSKEHGIERVPDVVPLGLNYEKFKQKINTELKVVGYAGTLRAHGQDVKRSYLVKEAVEKAGLQLKVAETYHNSYVTMPGFYQDVDAIMVASSEEGAGLPVLEGGAAGKLVLSTPVGHWSTKVGDKGGIELPFDEREYVNKAVETLLYYKNNPDKYVEKCQQIQNHAQNYDWSNVIDKWVNLLK